MSGVVITTNILAMNAHKNIKGIGRTQSKASERLASGSRINRSGDDAAGLAISVKMKAQIRGLHQAQRNAQDGISLLETMEGSMDNIQSMMIRQRELIVQAMNDTNSDGDKAKIQQEIDQITAEIGMVAERTTFNSIPLLNVPQNTSLSDTDMTDIGMTDMAAPIVEGLSAVTITPSTTPPTPTQTIDLSTLKNGDGGVGWVFNNGTLLILDEPGEVFELTGVMGVDRRITVADGATAEIILNNTTLNSSVSAALDMRGATVNLWLEGVNNLSTNSFTNAAIETTYGTLTIDGDGTLNAKGKNKAAIGGGQVTTTSDGSSGTIIINSGYINAKSAAGVGIGGGDHEDGTGVGLPAGKGANLIINGGWVSVEGGYNPPATGKIAIGGGTSATEYGGDGGSITITGGLLLANGSIGGGISSIQGGGGKGADVRVEGGLLYVENGWIGGGGDFNGNPNGPIGSTTFTNGNLSITDPLTNIKGGVENGLGDKIYATQVFMYDPINGQKLDLPPFMNATYTLEGDTYTGITDKYGGLYMYVPSTSKGAQDSMIINDISDLWIQCGANDGQGLFITRYDCRPESLYSDVFEPFEITVEINGVPKKITLTKLLTDPLESATASLIAIDEVFGKISSYRAKAGAQQNTLEFNSNSLGVAFTNLEDAHSRINDADMAKEMMNLVKANTLQQAGMAMLAQANQTPQYVLELLK